MNQIRNRLKISIDKKYHQNYLSLKYFSDKNIIDCPFEDLRQIFLLSASIGVLRNKYIPLKTGKESIFDSYVFNEHFDLPIIYSIAYSKDKKSEILSDAHYVLEILEGYANGGFPILWNEICNSPSNNLLNLSNYINEMMMEGC
jgi:hypothetical protein